MVLLCLLLVLSVIFADDVLQSGWDRFEKDQKNCCFDFYSFRALEWRVIATRVWRQMTCSPW